jgi:hypothetical protein
VVEEKEVMKDLLLGEQGLASIGEERERKKEK